MISNVFFDCPKAAKKNGRHSQSVVDELNLEHDYHSEDDEDDNEDDEDADEDHDEDHDDDG